MSDDEKIDIPILEIDPQAENAQCNKLDTLRNNRNDSTVKTTLSKIQEACQNNENLVPPIIRAAKTHATLCEIGDAMKAEFGEWQETAVF